MAKSVDDEADSDVVLPSFDTLFNLIQGWSKPYRAKQKQRISKLRSQGGASNYEVEVLRVLRAVETSEQFEIPVSRKWRNQP